MHELENINPILSIQQNTQKIYNPPGIPGASSTTSSHHGRAKTPTSNCSSSSHRRSSQSYSSSGGGGGGGAGSRSNSSSHFQPTKSTESLLLGGSGQYDLDATLSCECLDGPNPRFIAVQLEKHKRQTESGCTRSSSQRHRRSSHSEAKQRPAAVNSSELTRL